MKTKLLTWKLLALFSSLAGFTPLKGTFKRKKKKKLGVVAT